MILVTGGTGFVGSAVLARLVEDGVIPVRAAVRSAGSHIPPGIDKIVVGALAHKALRYINGVADSRQGLWC